jgi:outer membrane beta-barrel protein
MPLQKFYKSLILGMSLAGVSILIALPVKAAVELPEDELAQESVFPKFDNPLSVRSRNINNSKKIEVGGYLGFNFSEPIENQMKLGANLGYHWSEANALMFNYSQWMTGLNSQYTSSLNSRYGLDFNRAPVLQNSMWLHYESLLYYGKISLSKQTIMNFNLYPIMGLGMTTYSNKSYYGLDGGIGWKLFFSKRWALRCDLKIQYSGQPSPFLNGKMKPSQPTPGASDFKDITTLSTIFDAGLVALF